MDKLIVAFILDENLITHLKTVINSIVSKITIDYHICLLTNKEENIQIIQDGLFFLKSSSITAKVLKDEDKKKLDGLYIPEQRKDLTSFIYSQLLIPHYFKEHKKILFMEPDQVVKVDLSSFWREIHEKDLRLAAVESMAGEKTLETLKRIFPNRNTKRYNAGVVIYDTEYWIENNLSEKCFEECRKQKEEKGERFNFYAEGAMNLALQDYYQSLESKYNCMDLGFREDIKKEDIENAAILHWNGTKKPWNNNGLYKEYYIE